MSNKTNLRLYLTAIILLPAILLATTASLASGPSVQQAKLIANDAAPDDRFGHAVALDGDTALIGAPEPLADPSGPNTGLAYIFTRSGTTWSQQAKLVANDAADGDLFGVSVALSGDTALVGAKLDSDQGTFSGAAYVFIRSGTTWSQQAKLTASDGAALANFGQSVALAGDTALIGSRLGDGGVNTGSVYIFTRTGTSWSEQAKVTPNDADITNPHGFGQSVALAGDTGLIGAWSDNQAGSDSGSAYVFTRSGTTWSQQAKLTAGDGEPGDYFGWSVALAGDTALVGSRRGDSVIGDSGSAYIFTRSGTAWSQQAKLTASDAAGGDEFGVSVGLDGDTALVGARQDDDNGTDSGSAYIFTRSGTAWSQQAKLTASDAAAIDHFGWSVALAGDTALVGADKNDDAGSNSGSAYIFVPDNQPPTAAAGGPYLGAVNEPIIFDGSGSSDPNSDSLTYAWNFGDGNLGSGETPTHSYTAAGIYDVCLIVDDGSVESEPHCTMAVAYDPEGGFVTGGGWIWSEAGWCRLDNFCADTEGRANFGFVSKYKKGATIPTGNTEFNFEAGDLNFHSGDYEWLVITGNNYARYKGSGTINGQSAPGSNDFQFQLWAGDDEPDTFRIKIWYEDNGSEIVVYDNGMDQAIGGGSIKIHAQ